MKRILIVILIFSIMIINENKEEVIIPNEAIRFRVIASTNSISDQYVKKVVRDDLEKEIVKDLNESNNIDTTRKILSNNVNKYSNIVKESLEKTSTNETYKINYGLNYFPEKKYKGITYPEGNYESLVVTLGKGEGSNWWCVLFPPLCLLEADETEKEEVEYKSFIKEIIDKYIKF